METDFQSALQQTLDLLSSRDSNPNFVSELPRLIERRLPSILSSRVDSTTLRVLSGWRVGRIAHVPWVSIKPRRERATVTEGYYLSYLFARDGSAVYLCLETSVDGVTKRDAASRAFKLRTAAGLQSDLVTQIDLKSNAELPRKYEAGMAYAINYQSGTIPSDEELGKDLERMLDLLNSVYRSGFRLD